MHLGPNRGLEALDDVCGLGIGFEARNVLLSTIPLVPPVSSSSGLSPDNRAAFRTKTVATRLSIDELEAVETAAKQSGKTLAEWLREVALQAARPSPDVNELLLGELAATRYLLLNLFHASAKAAQNNEPFLPEAVLRIREAADARKLGTARKMLQDFLSPETKPDPKTGGPR